MDKRQLLRYIGDYSQLFGIEEYTLVGGKAAGVKAFDVRNGAGLEFTVVADRCMDIGRLSYKGVNCSYLSKVGVVSPVYYNGNDPSFFNNFSGGLLATCGLRNVGNSSTDQGESFPIHGRISNTPAEEVCASTVWEGDEAVMTLSGRMREARFFGENVQLKRKISCSVGKNRVAIQDCVENLGFRDERLMLLYHFNLGYPLLDEDAVLLTPSRTVDPRDTEALQGVRNWQQMQPPTQGYAEQVFYHDLHADEAGNTCVALVNRRLALGVALHFNKKQLFNFTQWKQMGQGEYVLGMEPCNCYVGGRFDPRNQNVQEYLKPGESKNFDIEIEILSGANDIQAIEQHIKRMAEGSNSTTFV